MDRPYLCIYEAHWIPIRDYARGVLIDLVRIKMKLFT